MSIYCVLGLGENDALYYFIESSAEVHELEFSHTYFICENSEFIKLSDLPKMAQPIKGRLGFPIPGAVAQTICS